MTYHPMNPLIVQGDMSVLIEVHAEGYEEARDRLARFAELIKSPEHIHTYKITPLSIWNAASAGTTADEMIATLEDHAKYELPAHVVIEIKDLASRYGKLKIFKNSDGTALELHVHDIYLAEEISHYKETTPFLSERIDDTTFSISYALRGRLKIELIKLGWPAEDLAGFVEGEKLEISLRETTRKGEVFKLRNYQHEAADVFYSNGSVKGGSGVIVLPCGAGKTVIGISSLVKIKGSVLILTTSVSAVRQWREELLDKTDIQEDQLGEYSGFVKKILPITICSYQILTHRKNKDAEFTHFGIFRERDWALIIYDEVHVLPAPIFQITAEIQSRRRLGLTATLVREDGRENEVFALIGPKKYDVPWRVLEKQGWIAKAFCSEIRLPMPDTLRMKYAVADKRTKFRIASENPGKTTIVKNLLKKHAQQQILIIGQYIEQLEKLAEEMKMPIITGKTPQKKRDELFALFKEGQILVLIVSKVANFALDLPDASVAIQISGTFGSRQEEAQRLGRILRPKKNENQAYFYTIVSRDTTEMDFARNRQLFLVEQGYTYDIQDAR